MGLGGISIWQLLIVLAIVIMIFGTKRLKNLGGDLGSAIKGFKKAVSDDSDDAKSPEAKKNIGDKIDITTQRQTSAEKPQATVNGKTPSDETVNNDSSPK